MATVSTPGQKYCELAAKNSRFRRFEKAFQTFAYYSDAVIGEGSEQDLQRMLRFEDDMDIVEDAGTIAAVPTPLMYQQRKRRRFSSRPFRHS